MKRAKDSIPEEPHADKHARFIRLLTDIAAVPKAAIYALDPKLRPKPRSKTGETPKEK